VGICGFRFATIVKWLKHIEFTFISPRMAGFAPNREALDSESEEDKQGLRRKRMQVVQKLG